uniref:RNase H type-1 domain-containing protein n=1 Tax=Manihot esculenta TaxID=3983 RepID=A0A2C9V6E1_MANES
MLGRVGWNLILNPHSFVASLLKARYYPVGSFLDAPKGTNPSFVWTSIRASQGLLRQGISWRIGSGSAVPIWLEPWLPDRANPFITSDFETSVGVHYVSDLIQDGTWNREVLSQVFNDRDRNLILSLPLPNISKPDSLYWRLSTDGFYSVKSAYKALTWDESLVSMNDQQHLWKKIWSLQLIPKVKNFIWRACSNILPVRSVLVSRHVPIQDVCPFCLVESETIFHALISCPFVRQVWRASYLGWFSPPSATFTEWLWKVLNLFNDSDVALALVLCWCLWEARNKCVWQQQTSTAVQIWSNAQLLFRQWTAAFKAPAMVIQPQPRQRAWSAPPVGWVKANVDASTKSAGQIGIGGVVRGDNGEFLACKMAVIPQSLSPRDAKLVAIREVLSWLKSTSWRNIVIETDCAVAVKVLTSNLTLDMSSTDFIIQDCKSLVNETGFVVRFVHVNRSGNELAHEIARIASSTS